MAECHSRPVTSHSVHDLHVHPLAAVPSGSYLAARGCGLERFAAHPLGIMDGQATASERPEHAVAFEWDALEAHRGGEEGC